jgi:hypothetical protein
MKTVIRRLADLEAASLAAKRSNSAGLVELLDRGLLTMEQLTDQELDRLVDPKWQPVMRQLSDDELDALISAIEKANNDSKLLADPVWFAANLTQSEQVMIYRYVELSEKAGLAWQG